LNCVLQPGNMLRLKLFLKEQDCLQQGRQAGLTLTHTNAALRSERLEKELIRTQKQGLEQKWKSKFQEIGHKVKAAIEIKESEKAKLLEEKVACEGNHKALSLEVASLRDELAKARQQVLRFQSLRKEELAATERAEKTRDELWHSTQKTLEGQITSLRAELAESVGASNDRIDNLGSGDSRAHEARAVENPRGLQSSKTGTAVRNEVKRLEQQRRVSILENESLRNDATRLKADLETAERERRKRGDIWLNVQKNYKHEIASLRATLATYEEIELKHAKAKALEVQADLSLAPVTSKLRAEALEFYPASFGVDTRAHKKAFAEEGWVAMKSKLTEFMNLQLDRKYTRVTTLYPKRRSHGADTATDMTRSQDSQSLKGCSVCGLETPVAKAADDHRNFCCPRGCDLQFASFAEMSAHTRLAECTRLKMAAHAEGRGKGKGTSATRTKHYGGRTI